MRTESPILIHDIIDEHEERMVNLKKFYPFFRLCDIHNNADIFLNGNAQCFPVFVFISMQICNI